jgi:hypothetical protein
MLMMADTLAEGIAAQFPDRFAGEPAANDAH